MSTLRKSYSLSDLSDSGMERSQDEVDEIVYGRANQMIQYRQMQPNQRFKEIRVQNHNHNGMNRSKSIGRTVSIYYDDSISPNVDNYE